MAQAVEEFGGVVHVVSPIGFDRVGEKAGFRYGGGICGGETWGGGVAKSRWNRSARRRFLDAGQLKRGGQITPTSTATSTSLLATQLLTAQPQTLRPGFRHGATQSGRAVQVRNSDKNCTRLRLSNTSGRSSA